MIAALYVETKGAYFGVEGVDPWGIKRDARGYAGDLPVVAHPPCARWCRLAALVEARWGLKRGEDGGCFQHALETVRRVGGVLEHPAYSDAWKAFHLNRPPPFGWMGQGRQARRLDLSCGARALRPRGKEGDLALRGPVSVAGARLGLGPGQQKQSAGVVVRESHECVRQTSACRQGRSRTNSAGVQGSAVADGEVG